MHSTFCFQPGNYYYNIEMSGTVEYILVTIYAKARNYDTFPILTNCWASSSGFEDIDAQVSKLAVFAYVEQGGMPVINANVE